MGHVEGAQAVVVGATGELGAAIVVRLRKAGVPVVAVARDRDRLEHMSATDGGITACPADIGDDSSGQAIAAAVSGPVRMVVQSAAVPPAGPLATIEPDALGRGVSLKLGGLLRLIRAVEDRFVEGSRIVAIGGHFGSEPTPQTCGAGVTNAALANLVRQLADAYGPRGVTVHMIAPGALDTDRLRRFAEAHAQSRGVSVETVLDEYRSHSPLGRMTTVDQVSWAVAQLLVARGRRATWRNTGHGWRRPPGSLLAGNSIGQIVLIDTVGQVSDARRNADESCCGDHWSKPGNRGGNRIGPRGAGVSGSRQLRSSADEADEVVRAITAAGGEAMAIRADVTEADEVDAMVREIEQRWGGVDVLVHNALIPFDVTSFADLTWDQLGGKLDRELRAAFLITKAVVPGMISRGYGRMVYLSTGLSRRPREGMITLGTSKAALDQFVRYVALELAPHGITANLVAPATVDETKVTEQLTDRPGWSPRGDQPDGTPRPPG